MLSKRFKTALLAAMAVLMLLPGAAFARDEMQNNDPNKYYIVLDTTNQVVTVYQKDDDGEYTRIVRRFVCTTGQNAAQGGRARIAHPQRHVEDRRKGALRKVRGLQ